MSMGQEQEHQLRGVLDQVGSHEADLEDLRGVVAVHQEQIDVLREVLRAIGVIAGQARVSITDASPSLHLYS